MNYELEVIRQSDNGIQTLGDLFVYDAKNNHILKCDSLELPWKNNQRKVSCIRPGMYKWMKVAATTAIPYEHILILNVGGRNGICIHKVNFVRDLKGCIGVGDNEIDIDGDGQKDVTNSGKTYDKIMKLLPVSGNIYIH